MSILTGIAKVLRCDEKSPRGVGFLGTGFALRQPTHFLTAAHCIGDLPADELLVQPNHRLIPSPVSRVSKHPTADLAVLELSNAPDEFTQPFWTPGGGASTLGLNFIAYGFPESVFDEDSRAPTPRLFKGHFQRTFSYQSPMGFRYEAGELSIACPGGLSGGPVFRQRAHWVVLGLVTENLTSTTVLDSIEEVQRDGRVDRKVYESVINYGVCVFLAPLSEWLDENVPLEPRHYSAKPLKDATIAIESGDDEYYALL
jgi:hypothetical protein